MKYKSKHNWFSRTILILCIVALLIRQSKSYYPLWCPIRYWFELADIALFFLLLVYFLYDWGRMRRYYKNEGGRSPAANSPQADALVHACAGLNLVCLIWNITGFLER